MREFFRGWRRKMGVATLVLACVLMALWMRSFIVADIVSIAIADFQRTYSVHSHSGALEWFVFASNPISCPDWNSCPIVDYPRLAVAMPILLHANGCGTQIFMIQSHHWCIVLSFTLLSAYLLLSKPRPRKPPASPGSPDEAQVIHA